MQQKLSSDVPPLVISTGGLHGGPERRNLAAHVPYPPLRTSLRPEEFGLGSKVIRSNLWARQVRGWRFLDCASLRSK
jgi:hypothetical protein